MQIDRRAFLASAVAAGALAGCLGSGGETDAGSGGNESDAGSAGSAASTTAGEQAPETTATGPTTSDADPTATPSGSSADETEQATSGSSTNGTAAGTPPAASIDHPAVAALAGQPYRGPTPGTAPGLIVAFEDPSCHNCERFNTGTLPTLEAELVEPGEATYVYRNFPHAYQWGEPAMQALEATYARSESAFWELKTHYFATQGEFSESNVLDRTQAFLTSETDLDAAAVVADAEAKEFDAAFQRDVDAGESAGVVSTPTFYLFREGEFLTEIRGAQSYDVFAQALRG
ncbi:DsbA family protein [Halococcus saccharolyticus]|uniref:Thioredoxin n=1 Tax=Halococcus saccharolyticus DSM 5350 TaxID=1227455 RepID=M0MJ27_9EURY|nr:thioredoxin domain-containing protein [Halococcus saccharolyticus]EMA44440.1 thioredoxin [Halococcus saccharolyticus DSM 5350]